ncbi:HAD-IIA family hydrolase [Saliphagus infecundisoli]|uniref:HAD-IIA family hydrolase n=1 Tax=Saliphagus infecundisoli TaxID=1849069 RepID=A0ABD5QHU2_9EURY|nr:HAD-IIA family hydrolase [Saliphagus infecundisoli]
MSDGTYDAAILDLDGTVYLGDRLVPGAAGAIEELRGRDLPVLFLTNKAIERRADYSEKLEHLGVPATREDVINSGWVTARYVVENYPDQEAFVIGEEPLIEELERAGIDIARTGSGDLLVVSMDREFTYEKLDIGMKTLESGAPFLATNPDRTCPTQSGAIPDAAGMIGAIEGVTGRSVDAMLGKPSATMLETVMGRLDTTPKKCLLIGDRLETDIAMGEHAGMTTVCVLSGVTDHATLAESDITPDYVLESIADIWRVFED